MFFINTINVFPGNNIDLLVPFRIQFTQCSKLFGLSRTEVGKIFGKRGKTQKQMIKIFRKERKVSIRKIEKICNDQSQFFFGFFHW